MSDKEQYLCKDCKYAFTPASEWLLSLGTSGAYLKCEKSYQGAHYKDDPVVGKVKVKARYELCAVQRKIGRAHV